MTSTETVAKPAVKRDKPTEEFGKFAGRMVRAWGRRAAVEDPWVIRDIVAFRDELDRVLAETVRGYVAAGYSWETIAAEAGMTKQACYKRFGPASS